MLDLKKWRRQGKELLFLARELLAPRCCAACGAVIEEGCFCEACRQSYLAHVRGTFRPRRDEYTAALGAFGEDGAYLDSWLCLFRYEGLARELIGKLKFQKEERLLQLLKEEAQLALPPALRKKLTAAYDFVAFVPTSPERLQRRGFDVPREIFSFLAGKEKMRPALLLRVRRTPPLYALNPQERREAVAGCFAVAAPYRQQLKGKKILLCDDIFTTGSTLKEGAAELRRQGAAAVGALTFAASREAAAQAGEDSAL